MKKIVIVFGFIMFSSFLVQAQMSKEFQEKQNELKQTKILARKYHFSEHKDSALFYYKQAVELSEKLGIANEVVQNKLQLAEFYRHTGQYELAFEELTEVNELMQSKNIKPRLQAYYFNRLAAVVSESGKDKLLVKEATLKALNIAEDIGDTMLMANSANELGFYYENRHNTFLNQNKFVQAYFDSSLYYYQLALKYFKNLNEHRSQLTAVINLTRLYYHSKFFEQAIDYANQGILLPIPINDEVSKRELYMYKSAALEQEFAYKEALLAHRKYAELENLYNRNLTNEKLIELQTQYKVLQQKETIDNQFSLLEKAKSNRLVLSVISCIIFIFLVILFIGHRKIKIKNKQLQSYANEKAFLIQEANHRIKNNLQLILSLIQREKRKEKNEEEITVLKNLTAKIESIGVLHKQLYTKDDIENVDVGLLLKDIIENVKPLLHKNNIEMQLMIENMEISSKLAVYLGILTTELIFNSLKHAFNFISMPQISIEFGEDQTDKFFRYSDNGVGIPEGVQPKLVVMMCQQLKATSEWKKGNEGMFLEIKFKA